MVERYLEVDVEAVTPMGDPVRFRAHGWQARILQHEVDHLKVNRNAQLRMLAGLWEMQEPGLMVDDGQLWSLMDESMHGSVRVVPFP